MNNSSPREPSASPRIVIVGAGLSGLCLAIQLKRAGWNSFTILEKSQDVAGTWLENTYPGCGCDVPAMLYSYSFARKPDWSRKYALQPELLAYFRQCADRFKIRPHVRFGVTVESAEFQEATGEWLIQLTNGEELTADVFVSAVGQLSQPRIPSLPGRDEFRGPTLHTAQWDSQFDPAGKRIAVIGSGASAIQVIPELAQSASQLHVFQRSPTYIFPRNDYAYSPWAKFCFRWIPGAALLHRWLLFRKQEYLFQFYERGTEKNAKFRAWLVIQMRSHLPKKMWRTVIPRYPAGCKRILLSDNYLQSLSRENVTLIPQGVSAITAEGVVAGDETIPVDAIVYATGFESNRFLAPLKVLGRAGKELNEAWAERPRTYLGIMVPEFPNFFMLYGPNTNLGHNSIIYMVESQVRWIMQCLGQLRRSGQSLVEPTVEATEAFDAQLQDQLSKLVWNEGCGNWYTNSQGHIVNNWSGPAADYRELTRRLEPHALRWFAPQAKGQTSPVTSPSLTGQTSETP